MRGSDSDVLLYQAVVDRVRRGESYYLAAGAEMHARGYATTPVYNWRLPTLAVTRARLPSVVFVGLLTLVGVGAVVLWARHLHDPRGAWPALLPLAMLAAWISPSASLIHELWAGQLIAISMAAWANRNTTAAVIGGTAALMVRELSALYVLVMAVMAWREGRRRELTAWICVLAAFGIVYGLHVSRAWALTPEAPLENSWIAFGGWTFVLRSARSDLLFFLSPHWILAIAIPALWAGLSRWKSPAGRRVFLTVTAYWAVFTLVGRPDNWYWGLLVQPLLWFGLSGWLVRAR
jgi:hypothetical protein